MSTVPPPVALAAFAAAPIAGADPMHTGLQAARIGIAGFLIPFVFVYHPAVFYKLQVLFIWFGGEAPDSKAMIDYATIGWGDLLWVTFAFMIAMWCIASALTGFDRKVLSGIERIGRAALGLLVLVPEVTIAGPALVAIVVLVGAHFIQHHRAAAPSNHT
jgi:TRAP-type uncharacterized transport system fused permease subunit